MPPPSWADFTLFPFGPVITSVIPCLERIGNEPCVCTFEMSRCVHKLNNSQSSPGLMLVSARAFSCLIIRKRLIRSCRTKAQKWRSSSYETCSFDTQVWFLLWPDLELGKDGIMKILQHSWKIIISLIQSFYLYKPEKGRPGMSEWWRKQQVV